MNELGKASEEAIIGFVLSKILMLNFVKSLEIFKLPFKYILRVKLKNESDAEMSLLASDISHIGSEISVILENSLQLYVEEKFGKGFTEGTS